MERPEFVVDFPTLLVAADWVQAHCIVPDGFRKGEPFELVEWQLGALLSFYRVRPNAKWVPDNPLKAQAFHFRRAQIVLPQKAGKAPYTAAHVCVEAVGPALFAGWAKGGEAWDCADHRCPCGWVYEYEPGEAMGMSWPTPLIQITAYSEDQTDNIYHALRPMIDNGPLHDLVPKTGEEFIRLPNDGRIDTVTSNALSRLGQRVTFVPQDETGVWTATNGMIRVAETQRRGAAGMGGRTEETTNAWDPNERSVAQRSAEGGSDDVFRHHPTPPHSLSYRDKRERRKIHRHVYSGCHWIDLDGIEAESVELSKFDAPQAERFFGNRCVAGAGHAFNAEAWLRAADPDYRPEPGAFIVVGVDGAQFQDALAIIGTEIATGFQFKIGIWERPNDAPDDFQHPMEEIDQTMTEAENFYEIWRIYIDPGSYTGNIQPLVDKWQGRWGQDRVIPWWMHRLRQTGMAVHNYANAISLGANGPLSHDGDPLFADHVANAIREKLNVRDENNPNLQLYKITKEHADSPKKIDAAAAGMLAWEARGDAIAEGAEPEKPSAWVVVV